MSKNNKKTVANQWSRRQFLSAAGGCSAMSALTSSSALLGLSLSNGVLAQNRSITDYKAMVCIQLAGGIDSFNVLAPLDPQGYQDYADVRGNLALDQSVLLPIEDSSQRAFGLHPGLGELATLYQTGAVALMANVGTLVEPVSLADYNAELSRLPLGLFSHSDQQQHWQTSVPQSRTQLSGWAGRMADMLNDASNANEAVSMNISLGGVNMLQTGNLVQPYVIGSDGAPLLDGYEAEFALNRILTRSRDSLLSQTYSNLMTQSVANRQRVAIDASIEFNAAAGQQTITTQFPESSLGQSLRRVAMTIGARTELGQARQSFFVSAGGWDHHDDVLAKQTVMLPDLSASLKAFHDALVELGVLDQVATFTISDFARTLTTNGNGSDHAWGGNHLIMGGGVKGGDVYGSYPESLRAGNSLDVGRGRILPTTSVDEYNAELAMWFGVQNNVELQDVFPNIRNFFDSSQTSGPIGFMPV